MSEFVSDEKRADYLSGLIVERHRHEQQGTTEAEDGLAVQAEIDRVTRQADLEREAAEKRAEQETVKSEPEEKPKPRARKKAAAK